MPAELTAGQRVVLRALAAGRGSVSVGVAPGALGRIVASLYDRGLVITTAQRIHAKSPFGDLIGWTITKAGRDALEGDAPAASTPAQPQQES